ncbi:zinc finger protein 300-like [Ahaetulla prasina]|uniref:zinc finger protein 300-like n=1 Tax=Ahaetulla prasina TaxID=499056 RepID=UPI002647A51C|nr:zinc finger protein 300-like [Ahaetulla prasina]
MSSSSRSLKTNPSGPGDRPRLDPAKAGPIWGEKTLSPNITLQSSSGEQLPETMQGGNPSEQSSPQWNQKRLSKCSECGKSFAYRSLLLIHRKLHTGNGSHLCFLCGNSFPGMWSFAKHLRSHPGLRPYKCGECGERFAKGSDLGAHQRLHQGKRLQECRKWWKRLCFSQKSELLQYLQIYTGDKLYKCGQCEKAFAQKSQLWLHEKVHKGIKSYDACWGEIAQRSSLRSRKKTNRRKEKNEECPECGKCFSTKVYLMRHRTILL